jgi:hypothetical protein
MVLSKPESVIGQIGWKLELFETISENLAHRT